MIMDNIPGADLLMNNSSSVDVKLPELETVSLDFTDLPSEPAPPPSLYRALTKWALLVLVTV